MIFFVAVFYIVTLIAGLTMIYQFIAKLATDGVNEHLQRLGDQLGGYAHSIIAFLTFRTEDMPYPFGPWTGEAPDPASHAPAKPEAPSKSQTSSKSPTSSKSETASKGRKAPAKKEAGPDGDSGSGESA
jgi:hypothetical protein